MIYLIRIRILILVSLLMLITMITIINNSTVLIFTNIMFMNKCLMSARFLFIGVMYAQLAFHTLYYPIALPFPYTLPCILYAYFHCVHSLQYTYLYCALQ